MGLPHADQPELSSAASPATARPTLPPEALDLAAKLFDFAREGRAAELAQYVGAGVPADLTNHKGDTLLMLAAYHGQLDAVRMLLGRGADVDALNDRGQSIVAGAVFKGYDDVVRALAAAGADLAAGRPSAIETARMFRREDLLRDLGVEVP